MAKPASPFFYDTSLVLSFLGLVGLGVFECPQCGTAADPQQVIFYLRCRRMCDIKQAHFDINR